MPICTVLIVSADPEFAAKAMAGWKSQPTAFITLGDSPVSDGVLAACDLAICGPAPCDSLVAILRSLHSAGRPAICLAPDPVAALTLRQAHPHVLLLPEFEGWFENMMAVGSELSRGIEAAARARSAETALEQAELHAALGRFMLDMRHSLNNALTSILGNAELLLLEPEKLSSEVRDQVAIVHEMALRIHDIILRFSALEQETRLNGKSHREMPFAASTILHATLPPSKLACESSSVHGRGMS